MSMTDQVPFAMMPKDQALDPQAREDLVSILIDTLWTDPAARLEARHYYLGRGRGLPAHQLDNAIYAIDRLARAPSEITWGALETRHLVRSVDDHARLPGDRRARGRPRVRQTAALEALSRRPAPSRAPRDRTSGDAATGRRTRG